MNICTIDSLLTQTGEFGAEEESKGSVDVQVVQEATLFGGKGSHYLVAFLLQVADALPHVVLFGLIVVEGQPFVGAHRDGVVNLKLVFPFHHIHILNPVAFAGAHHGADILSLEQIFHHHRKVSGSLVQHLFQPYNTVF